MKYVYLILLITALASCKTVGKQPNSYSRDMEKNLPGNNLLNDEDTGENLNIKTSIIIDGKEVVLINIQETGEFTLNGKEVEIIVFETEPKFDFIKIRADEHLLGVSAEYAWINYRYPGFRRTKQSLTEYEINGNLLPFDILEIENNETSEIKYLYFDISDFFGKF
jgi:hypothetical protein